MREIASAPHDALFSWSGGKDCNLALYDLQRGQSVRVRTLVATTTRDFGRISMHGVRNELIDRQAAMLGLPLERVTIDKGASNLDYEAATQALWARWRAQGLRHVAFGDLFLADIRAYRDRMLAEAGMTGVYPLWDQDTSALARRFIALGFKAVVVCVDPAQLDPAFAGRAFDESFLADLPPGVDPCGENGEFHTFVWHGPNFAGPVEFTPGETILRDGFWFTELAPIA